MTPKKMQLHWSPKSPYVRKVMVVAIETGMIDMLETIRTVATVYKPNPTLMQDNPLSKVPTLKLGNSEVLYDSAVICEYLDAQAKTVLFPQGEQRWQALRWQALGDGLLDTIVLWRHERERAEPARSPELLHAYHTKTVSALHCLEAELPNLKAAPFSIGHISLGCALGYLDFRMADLDWRTSGGDLAHWYSEIMKRPSFIETIPKL